MNESKYTTILEAVVGSTVHGVAAQDGLEDLDLMAIGVETLPLAHGFYREDVWTQRTKPEGVRSEAGDIDYVAYGLRKYLGLALKCNPSVLLALFVPPIHIRTLTHDGAALRELAPKIVSKLAYSTFRGYMRQQHERLIEVRGQRNVTRPELIEKYGFDTKYAGHIVRLGFQGEELLLTGRITLPMPQAQREFVLGVRTGALTLNQVSDEVIAAENRLNAALERSPLPELPDNAAVQDWMLSTYLRHWRN